jgi:hypothetical protein
LVHTSGLKRALFVVYGRHACDQFFLYSGLWEGAMNKICRICWNTHDWRQPTGEAAKLEKGGTTRTYVQTQGYGLEEWLFNFSWLHRDGNKYGYLQPIAKYRSKYEGTTFNILVYVPQKIASSWH